MSTFWLSLDDTGAIYVSVANSSKSLANHGCQTHSDPLDITGHFNHWLHPRTPRLLSLSATANAWRSKSGGKSSNLSMPVQCSIPGGLFISDWLKDKLWVKRDEAGKNNDDDDDDDDDDLADTPPLPAGWENRYPKWPNPTLPPWWAFGLILAQFPPATRARIYSKRESWPPIILKKRKIQLGRSSFCDHPIISKRLTAGLRWDESIILLLCCQATLSKPRKGLRYRASSTSTVAFLKSNSFKLPKICSINFSTKKGLWSSGIFLHMSTTSLTS